MPRLHFINESNKLSLNKPADTDQVYYSELNEWFTNNAFRSFSIKLVAEGTIYYRCGAREYAISKDHFLLTSRQPGVKAYFTSKQPVKSVCIDICPRSLSEVFTILKAGGNDDPDKYCAGYFEHPHFFEKIYNTGHSPLGNKLSGMAGSFLKGNHEAGNIGEEWFLQLVELVIAEEKTTFASLNNLSAKKTITRKEIYRRVLEGKQYMDDCYLDNPGIATIAQQCHLSPYHFFRNFRQAFHTSPYQYMLQLRLQYALQLLQHQDQTLTDIAVHCGFPDLFTFSKAFKRKYGSSPKKMLQ